MRLSEDRRDQFRSQGWIRLAGVVPLDRLDALFSATDDVLRSCGGDGERKAFTGWDDRALHAWLIRLREADRDRFGAAYGAANASLALARLFLEEDLVTVAAELLGDPAGTLSLRDPCLRMDTPRDTRATYDWHQDSAYSDLNASGESSVVCWVPLHPVDAHCGTMRICSGSHVRGRLDVTPIRRDRHSAEQRKVPDEALEGHAQLDLEGAPGEAVFFHGDLIHRSGFNASDRVRFTAVARYHRTLAQDSLFRS